MRKRNGLILLSIIILDQLTKYFVFHQVKDNVTIIDNFFYISKIKNPGAAWGVFSGQMWLFYIVSAIALYFLIKIYIDSQNKLKYFQLGIVLMISGTIGNLIDRVLFGYVRDFLNFFIFTYDYPVFNVADMSLVIGVGLVIIYLFKHPDEELL